MFLLFCFVFFFSCFKAVLWCHRKYYLVFQSGSFTIVCASQVEGLASFMCFLVLIYTGKIKNLSIDLGVMVREEVECFWWGLKDIERRCSLLCDIMLSLGACQLRLFVIII